VKGKGQLRFKSQVPPGNFGPISRILNHTFPEPSKSTAAPGALAMYTEIGPWWYTAVSVVKDTADPAARETVPVVPPVAPPALQRRSLLARSL
jgi:hypothetical protein